MRNDVRTETLFVTLDAVRENPEIGTFQWRWTDAEIPSPLLRLNAAMDDEVELTAGLDARRELLGHGTTVVHGTALVWTERLDSPDDATLVAGTSGRLETAR